MREDRYFLLGDKTSFHGGAAEGLCWVDSALMLKDGAAHGIAISPVLDSGKRGNRWQRLRLDAQASDGALCEVRLYGFDRAFERDAVQRLLEDGYASVQETISRLAHLAVFHVQHAHDVLLTQVQAQYLVAVVQLHRGLEGASPALHRLWLYAEQETFLPYLPEIFQEEGSFLDRYLRLFSTPYLELEREIERLPGRFDPRVAPASMLPYLAEVMGIPHRELWESDGLRKLLCSRVYTRKGTLEGLAKLLNFYCGAEPYLVESFRMRTGIAEAENVYAGCRLCVFLPHGSVDARHSLDAYHLLIQSFVPEGLSYKIFELDNRALLSGATYLDINACLSGVEPAVLETQARLEYVALGD